jgi:RNA polymerase II subunit A small phosphatase-like protein
MCADLLQTAGLTSAAVQPPGSGPINILATPTKLHPSSSSDIVPPSSSSDPEKTDTSGGYTNLSSESEAVDADGHRDHEHDHHQDDDRDYDQHQQQQQQQQDDYDQGQEHDEYDMDDYEDEEDRLIAQGGMGIPLDAQGRPAPLLPEIAKVHQGRKCLVLDLDETLLHSSFKVRIGCVYSGWQAPGNTSFAGRGVSFSIFR